MTLFERHEQILKQLKENGKVLVQQLSADLDVSEVTIRKDLRILEDKGLLFKTYGGATRTNPYTNDRPVGEKQKIHSWEKEAIARAALPLAGHHDSLILGSGTTVLALARLLQPERETNIITSALNISLELAERPHTHVLQLGGQLRATSSSVVGPYAESFLAAITCGVFFLGVDGIDVDFGLTTTNLDEARLNQKCIEIAQTTVLLADSSKFGKRGFGRICDSGQVQHIVTDDGVDPKTVRQLKEKGVKVTIAP